MKTPPRHEIKAPDLPKNLQAASLKSLENQAQVAQMQFSGDDLSGQQAGGIFFEQVTFKHMGFMETGLASARFFDCRMESSDLSGAVWEKSRFRRVEFTGCRLLGADLTESDFQDVVFKDCKADDLVCIATKFKGARFEKCTFTNAAFEGSDLTGAVFHECDLSGADLRNTKLNGADLRTSNISGVQSGIKELQGAIIAPVQAAQVVTLLGIKVEEPFTPESDL